jgi:hypothetical protein
MPNSSKNPKDSVDSNMDSRICNPARHRKPGETCLSLEALEKMKQVWNKTHPDQVIRSATRKNKRNSGSKRLSLWKELRNSMKSYYDCDNEYCTLKKLPGMETKLREKFAEKYFRPEKPEEWNAKETTWLDSFNIEDVMNQYEDAYNDFEFIGPVPIDFDAPSDEGGVIGSWGKCIVDELCKLDLKDAFKKGTKRIGIIFNLDKHDEPGSHWVCGFIDVPKKSAYYFDSYGLPPPPEVSELLERCKEQGCDTILYNDIRHQRKDSECGMYCLYTIICLIKGRSFQAVCMDIVKDDTMNAFRDVLFASVEPRKEAMSNNVLTLTEV